MAHTQVTVLNPQLQQQRNYTIEKAIFFIGSDPKNDVVLQGTVEEGVYPRHIQIIAVDRGGYRLVNLGLADLSMGEGESQRTIEPRSSVNLTLGLPLQLAGYTVIISDEETPIVTPPTETDEPIVEDEPASRSGRSKSIDLAISLSHTLLALDAPIEGTITVRNLGNKPGVQFLLELEGLEPGTYELGPGPILFPNAEKSTFLKIRHPQKSYPPAGKHRFSITAIAPEDYPGETAVVVQTIKILPFYRHKLRLMVS